MKFREVIKRTLIGLLKSAWAVIMKSAFFWIFAASVRLGADIVSAYTILVVAYVAINCGVPRLAPRARNPVLRYMLSPSVFTPTFRRRFWKELRDFMTAVFSAVGEELARQRDYEESHPRINPATGAPMTRTGFDTRGYMYGSGPRPGRGHRH